MFLWRSLKPEAVIKALEGLVKRRAERAGDHGRRAPAAPAAAKAEAPRPPLPPRR